MRTIVKKASLFLAFALLASAAVLCACDDNGKGTDSTNSSDESANLPDDSSNTENETTDEETQMNIKDELKLDVKMSVLDELMQPIFLTDGTMDETVMFIGKGDKKSLLFPIDTVISVTSYDGSIKYTEGTDYVVEDGMLKVTETSSIPVITSEVYYDAPGSILQTKHDGKRVLTYWGEGQAMTNWQVCVNYTHNKTWEGYMQPSELEVYASFIKKLQNGEDVTVMFYGDSITYGANASWICNYAPYNPSYPIMFVQALADLFSYTVHYEAANLIAPNNNAATSNVPAEDYVAGNRGTITYVNTSIGGWRSTDGVKYLDTFVKDKIEAHGCDLFVVAFGMNDNFAPGETRSNLKAIVDGVLQLRPEANIVLMSTMVPNPNSTNGWYGYQDQQQNYLKNLAKNYRANGISCGTCCMTSVSLAVLEHKEFCDYSGNNINHPNDFFVRIYAQTLLQTVIGYENMN
ncbi:MAG: SGNH/GDSL hydrolase family protein [Eubacteriales bacterium]